MIEKQQLLRLRRAVMEKSFSRMNDMQREAVFKTEGPLLVLAGAGSGKTTVIVNRIANIIRFGQAYHSPHISDSISEEDVEHYQACIDKDAELPEELLRKLAVSPCAPWRVMAITFTNKAAGELKERLKVMLGDEGEEIWASTFHSSCARILRRHAELLGYSSHFAIYDTDDCRRLMKICLKEADIPKEAFNERVALNAISRAKDSLMDPDSFARETVSDYRQKMISQAYKLYQDKLRRADAMDFDDLIVNTVKLLQSSEEVRSYYQNRFRYVMVDEYQDTNQAQYELVSLLAGGYKNLCVVGDDDQSIYKFRGATIENIMNFEKDFPGAAVVRLEQNYRSTQNILDAANAVISNNSARKGKNLWTANGSGKLIHFHIAADEQDEAARISDEILEGVANGRSFSDYAVLYRMNAQSLTLERSFLKQGIPHRILGGLRFYERMEVKDMLAYLSVINNPSDAIRMRRIINTPKRGIGEASFDRVLELSEQTGDSIMTVISNAQAYSGLSRTASKLKSFGAMINRLIEMNGDESVTLDELYRELLESTGYIEYLKTLDNEKAEDRIENVYELSSNLQQYAADYIPEIISGEESLELQLGDSPEAPLENTDMPVKAPLSGFLEEVSLFTDIDNYDASASAVVLMTIHSAKGLEFPCVFLPGLEEGVFPGRSVIYDPAEVEEERRLAYVAITRAKEELSIYASESRILFGSSTRNPVSRFIAEIPEEMLESTRSRENPWSAVSPLGSSGGFGTTSGAAVGSFKKPVPMIKKTDKVYAVGDTVTHKAFGTGLIISATPMANDTLLEISFDKVGTKKLFANYAKLS